MMIKCYIKFVTTKETVVDEKALRQKVLTGKKSDRIIFAVTPEMKQALNELASDQCTTVSALLTKLATDAIVSNKTLFAKEGE